MSQRIITIGNKEIEAEEKELPQADLLFYKENPRIYTILKEIGENPSQQSIEQKMISLNHVKILKESIKANGGLLEPIIVRKNVVLEGNSRLAAYRILAKIDPVQWGMIKCNVLPDDTDDEVVTALLGTLHVIGKTQWSPFEQAGFLVRRVETSRKPIDALAFELGMRQNIAKLYIDVYNAMLAADDMNPTKWSYYYELLKNKDIKKYDENNPSVSFLDNIIEQIKDDKIDAARDIRTFAKLAKTSSENAEEAISAVFDGEITLEEAEDLISADTKKESIIKKIETFAKYIAAEQKDIKDNSEDVRLNFELKKIYTLIQSTLNL